MATPADPVSVAPSTLRRLARENQELGIKLARHEYRAMLSELSKPEVFDLAIDFPNDGVGFCLDLGRLGESTGLCFGLKSFCRSDCTGR